jgi:hypothetical protein
MLVFVAALAIASVAQAQGGAPKIARARGVVVAVAADTVTLDEADGKREAIPLLPGWTVIVSKPIPVEAIAPGSYLGTTNHAGPGETGVSTEVHVSPPGVNGPGVDFLMDADRSEHAGRAWSDHARAHRPGGQLHPGRRRPAAPVHHHRRERLGAAGLTEPYILGPVVGAFGDGVEPHGFDAWSSRKNPSTPRIYSASRELNSLRHLHY